MSTDNGDQSNSFESQKRYFRDYIARQPGWELYAVYADEGTTGTSTSGREAFNRMIGDAEKGYFELILTKEVSRFSRNILDSIAYTRRLRGIGVGVRFMNDGICTLDPDAELRLSILSGIAQEESRRISSRVKWGQARRMEQGVVFGRSMLGYDVKDGKMSVNPRGAEIVRMIFAQYVYEHRSASAIARDLEERGIRTYFGNVRWRRSVILKILRNEKYCGDLRQKKTYTPDYLTHRKKYNRGQEETVFLRGHHEPIVPRSLWEEAQREISRRTSAPAGRTGGGRRYPLSGRIRCGVCGKAFVARVRTGAGGKKYRVWRCGTAAAAGARSESGCGLGYQLRGEQVTAMLRDAFASLQIDRSAAAERIAGIAGKAVRETEEESRREVRRLRKELESVTEKKKSLLDAYLSGRISENDLELMNGEYSRQADTLSEQAAAAESRVEHPGENTVEKIRCEAERVLGGETAGDGFYLRLAGEIVALPGRRVKLRLKGIGAEWIYPVPAEKRNAVTRPDSGQP